MTPGDIDRVLGRGRLRMVTGDHVEVFREETNPGERRRYTKRFLATTAGDFRHWTEREWRILARLVGHGIAPVPDVVQFDRGSADRPALVQTYDAGVTVDHWATLLPVLRDGVEHRHVFEDAAHWWALARHCLIALDAIHGLRLVHLDLKADNVCIPLAPADFDPDEPAATLWPRFEQIALIDFAFSLVEGERLTRALPIARQPDYEYQSPRLLHALEAGAAGDLGPTQRLDWRCDFYSLAAMLRRFLPDPESAPGDSWSVGLLAEARALVRRLLEAHDDEAGAVRPHGELIALASRPLDEPAMAASLERGWQLAASARRAADELATPITRIAAPLSEDLLRRAPAVEDRLTLPPRRENPRRRIAPRLVAAGVGAAAAASVVAAGWWAWQGPAATQRAIESAAATAAAKVATAPAPVEQAAAPSSPPPVEQMPSTVDEPPVPTASVPASEPAAVEPESPASAAPLVPPAPAPIAARGGESRVEPAAKGKKRPSDPPQSPRPSKRQALAAAPAAPAAAPGKGAVATRRPAARVAASPSPPPAQRGRASSERERVLAWLTMRGPSPKSATTAPGPAMPAAVPPAVTVPAAVPPAVVTPVAVAPPPPPPAAPPLPSDLTARGEELLVSWLPRAARRAEPLVAHVLVIAAQAEGAQREDEIRIAANALGVTREDGENQLAADPGEARRLADAAAKAYWRRGQVREALGLQLRAFGANPLDAQIAGQFALLQLKDRPAQAETARQLALHALVRRDTSWQGARAEDWSTLAIANALLGRQRDARNAWFVALAVSPQPETQCRAAINAYSRYGEPLRATAEAVLARAASAGLAGRSPLCAWPPYWQSSNGGWR